MRISISTLAGLLASTTFAATLPPPLSAAKNALSAPISHSDGSVESAGNKFTTEIDAITAVEGALGVSSEIGEKTKKVTRARYPITRRRKCPGELPCSKKDCKKVCEKSAKKCKKYCFGNPLTLNCKAIKAEIDACRIIKEKEDFYGNPH